MVTAIQSSSRFNQGICPEMLPKKGASHKIYSIGVTTIQFLGVVFVAISKAGYLTLRESLKISFKACNLTNARGLISIPSVSMNLSYFIFSVLFTFLANTVYFIKDKYPTSNEIYIKTFITDRVNPYHIEKTKNVQIDAKHVPNNIKVNDLISFFDQIDFKDKNKLGYMHPNALKDENEPHTVEELKKNLNKFVNNVNNRVAFVGTPPSHDFIGLDNFYQNIENALRLSIQKVISDLEDFEKAKGTDEAKWSLENKKEYKNLLENRARLAIDCAIAGKYCGARYMGNVMNSYYTLCDEKEGFSGALEEALFNLLAKKRAEVGKRKVSATVHDHNAYMQHIGTLLKIPGSENFIEHLSTKELNYEAILSEFFKVYNEQFIIDLVQNKVKESANFRNLAYDWIKNNTKVLIPSSEVENKEKEIRNIISSEEERNTSDSVQEKNIVVFNTILNSLGDNLPLKKGSWENWVKEVFSQKKAKEIAKKNYLENGPKNQTELEIFKYRNSLISFLCQQGFSSVLEKSFNKKNNQIDIVNIKPELEKLNKVKKIREVLWLPEATIKRILNGKADLKIVIKDCLIREKRREIAENAFIKDEEEVIKELKQETLDEILIEHGIFEKKIEFKKEDNINSEKTNNYIKTIFDIAKVESKDAFDIAFSKNPEKVIAATKTIATNYPSICSTWKKVIHIKAPEITHLALRNQVVKVIISVILTLPIYLLNIFIMRTIFKIIFISKNPALKHLSNFINSSVGLYSTILIKARDVMGSFSVSKYINKNYPAIQSILSGFALWVAGQLFMAMLNLISGGALMRACKNLVTVGLETSSRVTKLSNALDVYAKQEKKRCLIMHKRCCQSVWKYYHPG
ncbi:MAG: hypothetical protein AAF443_03120 [Chlamydiota bacterium]